MKINEIETSDDLESIDLLYALENPPKGVKTSMSHKGYTQINFQRTIQIGRNLGLGIFAIVLMLVSYLIFTGYFHMEYIDQREPLPVFIAYLLFPAIAFITAMLVYNLFLKRTYFLYPDRLEMISSVLMFNQKKIILRESISSLTKQEDGTDIHPGWGLEATLEDKTKIRFVTQQPYYITNWFGEVLTTWSGLELS